MKQIEGKTIIISEAYKDYDESIVKIKPDNIKLLKFDKELTLSDNENEVFNNMNLKDVIKFIIGLNSINYKYWDLVDDTFIRYKNNNQEGALAAFDGFVNLWENVKYPVSEADVIKYFGNIPDIKSRVEILNESLNPTLLETVSELILDKLEYVAVINTDFAFEVANLMPKSFKEPYLKKIQLALYEIVIHTRKYNPEIIEDLTVAADYQLPKVLEAIGILEYNSKLTDKISKHQLIEEGSKEEKAIRAATIIACELISNEHNVSIPTVDRALWLARKNYTNKNFHLTKTTAY